jgi:GNAT superfamily N-acetyltransferase
VRILPRAAHARCRSANWDAVTLADGTTYRIRSIRPEDKDMLSDGLQQLTPESRHRRFLAAKPRLTSRELRYLTEVDFADHHAVLAVTWEHPERLVGVGRWVRSTVNPKEAEIAVVVGDPAQHQGVGKAIITALADAAAGYGIECFVADMLPTNRAAHRLLAVANERLRALDGT